MLATFAVTDAGFVPLGEQDSDRDPSARVPLYTSDEFAGEEGASCKLIMKRAPNRHFFVGLSAGRTDRAVTAFMRSEKRRRVDDEARD